MTTRFLGVCVLVILVAGVFPAQALTQEERLAAGSEDLCEDAAFRMLREERDAYRSVQTQKREGEGVLLTPGALTSDLVPYLVLNIHALDCRLRAVCDAVSFSTVGEFPPGAVPPHRPIGCSRLFAARGRWWDQERRTPDLGALVIPDCDFSGLSAAAGGMVLPLSALVVEAKCDTWADKILAEERQLLRLLVAQDATERGTRRAVGVLQAALTDVRAHFLLPLRSLVGFFGSVIHPVPCLLTQCN